VLGALAIISAILIVLADRDRRNNKPVEQTVTDTVTPTGQSAPSDWTHDEGIGRIRFTAASSVIAQVNNADPPDETPR
jgi:eukaryotic-like serine/threonine-protein kinase